MIRKVYSFSVSFHSNVLFCYSASLDNGRQTHRFQAGCEYPPLAGIHRRAVWEGHQTHRFDRKKWSKGFWHVRHLWVGQRWHGRCCSHGRNENRGQAEAREDGAHVGKMRGYTFQPLLKFAIHLLISPPNLTMWPHPPHRRPILASWTRRERSWQNWWDLWIWSHRITAFASGKKNSRFFLTSFDWIPCNCAGIGSLTNSTLYMISLD